MNKSYQKKYLTKPSPDTTPNGFPYHPGLFIRKSLMGKSFQSNKSPAQDMAVSGRNIYTKKSNNFPDDRNWWSQVDGSPNQTQDFANMRSGERSYNPILNISTPVIGEQLRPIQ
jgi:hypothetical protein